jgi:hypothetical protein
LFGGGWKAEEKGLLSRIKWLSFIYFLMLEEISRRGSELGIGVVVGVGIGDDGKRSNPYNVCNTTNTHLSSSLFSGPRIFLLCSC